MEKNKEAQKLGKRSWTRLTPEEKKKQVERLKKATHDRWANMTKAERSAYGKKLSDAATKARKAAK